MKIEHIAMYFSDLEKAKGFFMKYFGAVASEIYHNKTTDFKSYFLLFDGETRLEIMNKPKLVSKSEGDCYGFAHIAFSTGSKEKVNELTELIRDDGFYIRTNPRTTGDGYYESCVCDIENNLIEITV